MSFALVVLGFLQFHVDKFHFLVRRNLGYAVVNPELCGNDEVRSQNVFDWVKVHGGWIHQNLSVGTFPLQDGTSHELLRGLVATGEIAGLQDILRIPANLLLNLATVRNDSTFRPVYETTPEFHDGLAGLAVYLIHESLNSSSFWRPYLCSLPKAVPLPIFYSPQKLLSIYSQIQDKYEGGRAYLNKMLRAMQSLIDSKYKKLMPVLFKKYPELFNEVKYSRSRWAWAMSIILSRTWGRPFEDSILANHTGRNKSNIHTLVPAADMPNHDSLARPAQFRSENGNSLLVLQTNRRVRSGEQVLISYGSKCDLEFLVNCELPNSHLLFLHHHLQSAADAYSILALLFRLSPPNNSLLPLTPPLCRRIHPGKQLGGPLPRRPLRRNRLFPP